MSDQNVIVRYAIYPGIGIARVGNSPDEYFIGPEAPGEFSNTYLNNPRFSCNSACKTVELQKD